MNFQEMEEAVSDAETTIRVFNESINSIARLVTGKLKMAEVYPWILADLKRELRDFDARTGEWK